MAVNSESTIIIDVSLQANDARTQSDALGESLERLSKENAELRKDGKLTSTLYVENAQKIRQLTAEQKAYVTIANAAKGSNNQLRAQLSLLTSQYNALSKEERENTVAGKALTIQTRAISDELKNNEDRVGDNRRSVGDYTKSINASVVGQLPFINQLKVVTEVLGALKGTVEAARAATEAQTIAVEINTAASLAAEEAAKAQAAATEAQIIVQRQAIVAEELRAEAELKRIAIDQELINSQESLAAVTAQLAAEQAAIAAEEQLRVVAEQELVAAQAELTAVEEARVATETALAASTASVAAAEQSVAAQANVMKVALASTGIGAIIVLVGTLATYLGNLDSVTDGTSVVFSALKAQVNELGRSIISLDFTNLTTRLTAAGIQAAVLTEQAQSLEDSLLNQSVKSSKAQAEVQKLRVEALNRTLGPEARQRLLAQAEQIDADDLAAKKKLADRELQQAEISIAITGNLTKYQRDQLNKRGVEYALYLQNNLVKQGKVTDDQTKALAKAYENQTQIQNEFTQRSEKRQNLSDRIADQAEQKKQAADAKAEAAAQKRASELEKINADRVKSELATAATLLTVREKEVQDINADIDKRVLMYRKYGQDTANLERERTARLLGLTTKYFEEDAKIIEDAFNKAIDLRIQSLENGSQKESDLRQVKNERELADIDKQILAISARIAKGEEDKNGVLDALFAERKAATDKQAADDFQRTLDFGNEELQRRIDRSNMEAELQQQDFDIRSEFAQKEAELNAEKFDSYVSLFDGIAGLLNKNSVAGKIAFGISKALAIAQIVINAELEKSEIAYRSKIEARQLAIIPVIGPALAIARLALAGVEIATVTAREVSSSAVIAAQTIVGIAGKAKGGIQDYKSDGKGAILPGYATKDDTNAYLRSGEAVVVSEAARDPQTRSLLSAINVAYGGNPFPGTGKGYAMGGVYAGSALQKVNGDITNQIFQQNQLNQAISQLKIYTAITDINTGQNNYAKIVSAANFE